MTAAHAWICGAVLAGAAGTYMQSLGAANPGSRHLLAFGTILTAFAVYSLWSGQQLLLQEASAKPVLDSFVDGGKTLHLRNLGTVALDDVRVDATSYALKLKELPEGHGHVAFAGIESFSKPSRPVFDHGSLHKRGGEILLDLTSKEFSIFTPIYEGIPDVAKERGRTIYCFRILLRNAVTKQRLVKYVLTGAYKDFPDMLGESRGTALGGGYESSLGIFEIRNLIRSHQASLFDDDVASLYRD